MNYCRGCGAGTLDDKDWCPSCGPSLYVGGRLNEVRR
jgi:rRNA maturation protein Nop10